LQFYGLTGVAELTVVLDAVFVPKFPTNEAIGSSTVTDRYRQHSSHCAMVSPSVSPMKQATSMIVVLNAFNIVCNVPQTIAWISHSKTHDGIRDIGAKRPRKRSHGNHNGNARDRGNLFVRAKYADVPCMNARQCKKKCAASARGKTLLLFMFFCDCYYTKSVRKTLTVYGLSLYGASVLTMPALVPRSPRARIGGAWREMLRRSATVW